MKTHRDVIKALSLLTLMYGANSFAASPDGENVCVDSNGVALPVACRNPQLSADGNILVMESDNKIYIRSLISRTTLKIGTGKYPQISADGRVAVWINSSTSLGVYRVVNGNLETSTVTVPGATYINFFSKTRQLSADGRFVAFRESKDGLAHVYDLYRNTNTIVSRTPQGTLPSTSAWNYSVSEFVEISGDGQYVFWDTDGNEYTTTPTPTNRDVIRRNWRAATPVNQVVTSYPLNGAFTCGAGYYGSSSASGKLFSFQSYNVCDGTNDPDTDTDIIIRNPDTSGFTMASVRSDGTHTTDTAQQPLMSSNGRYVLFTGPNDLSPPNLPIDSNAAYGVYIRDRWLNTTERVSMGGYAYFTGTGWSWQRVGMHGSTFSAAMAADGHYIIYGGSTSLLGLSYVPRYPNYIDVKLQCNNATTSSTQAVYAIGSLPQLGEWVRPLALKLSRSGTTNTWTANTYLPPNTAFEWKCMRRAEANAHWLNANERKSGDTIDPLLWSNTGSGANGNFTGFTNTSGSQTFSGSF